MYIVIAKIRRIVCGPITPSEVGKTLTHEHLSMTFMCTYREEPAFLRKRVDFSNISFNLKDLHWIQQYPYCYKPNLLLNECNEDIVDEISLFKLCGGSTIVDNTTHGIDPDLGFLYTISKNHGINIVSGCGYYVACAQSNSTLEMSIEDIADSIRKKLTMGESVETADGFQNIKSGCIGEIGCSWPIHGCNFEKKSLQASALVQSETNCPVIIHPGRDEKAPFEIMRIFQEAGGKADRTVMSHLDRTLISQESLSEFAKIGCYNEFDLFGIETSYYLPNTKISMPNDGERIKRIKYLIEEGYENKITISHDIHTKHRLMNYGGHGLSHIFLNVVNQMSELGMAQTSIDKILIDNPKEWLTFNCK
ncbi:Phosphotriesterase-related protein [Nymphon striatum]|nr:Phosphotriesterase-related protein [Nymphon striatum]